MGLDNRATVHFKLEGSHDSLYSVHFEEGYPSYHVGNRVQFHGQNYDGWKEMWQEDAAWPDYPGETFEILEIKHKHVLMLGPELQNHHKLYDVIITVKRVEVGG